MLITKTIKIKWSKGTKKHYVALGYEFTNYGDEFEVKVEDLTKGSNIKVDCICDNCGKESNITYQNYNTYVKENGKTYCNNCASKLYGGNNISKSRVKNGKSFYQWCIEHNRQDVLDRWDYEINDCSPKDVSYSTHKKYWFKCDKHSEHKSELKSVKDFINGHEGSINCNQCNSIAQWFIDNNLNINDYWDFEKNIVDPWDISYGSNKKVWFKCTTKKYHGSYEKSCCGFISGKRCPFCNSNSGQVHPKDSLGQYIIDEYGEEFLWSIWSDKNKKTPFEYASKSNIKIWWKCPCGKHEDCLRNCNDSVKYEFRCPKCVEEMNNSVIENKTKSYLYELGYSVLTEHECTIRPINPKTKYPMPFDNEIVLENGKHLIIEVHGKQHYKHNFYKTMYNLIEEEAQNMLHQRQLYDRYKRMKCKQANYEYLEIPYTTFNKEETYKELIDNKINEILNIDKTS